MTSPAARPRVQQVHCNECARTTNHDVIAERKQPGNEQVEDDITIWWETVYTMLECRGCNSVVLRKVYTFSEWNPGDAQVEFFPPPAFRRMPDWVDRLPEEERQLLSEIYHSLASDSRRLAVIGARSLLDLFITRVIGDVGSFEHKLEVLGEQGFVSAKNRDVLAAALEAGNASAHRGFNPSHEHLIGVINIVENVLQADLLRQDAADLRAGVPPRPARGRHSHPGA